MIHTGTRHLILALLYTKSKKKKKKKLQDKENVLKHYQRAFKKNILITRYGPAESSNTNIFLSPDNEISLDMR